jgi:hypothetical protein
MRVSSEFESEQLANVTPLIVQIATQDVWSPI